MQLAVQDEVRRSRNGRSCGEAPVEATWTGRRPDVENQRHQPYLQKSWSSGAWVRDRDDLVWSVLISVFFKARLHTMNAAGVGGYMHPQNGWTHQVIMGVWQKFVQIMHSAGCFPQRYRRREPTKSTRAVFTLDPISKALKAFDWFNTWDAKLFSVHQTMMVCHLIHHSFYVLCWRFVDVRCGFY